MKQTSIVFRDKENGAFLEEIIFNKRSKVEVLADIFDDIFGGDD